MDYAARTYDLYHDIQKRTGGEIYIGVLGPVRTGKSTFIKRFMEEMVLPLMEETPEKTRAQDEMPQSAGGRTITTTEPKFIPSEAAKIALGEDLEVKVRLIDCVGYMVPGATGHLEEEQERMVKTPWFDVEIPFSQAAQTGTDKVMNEHSTIGLVITTDGTIGEIPRENYLEAEEKTILALKRLGKPFLVLVNTKKPFSDEAAAVARQIMETYQVAAQPVNCEQLKKEDIHKIMERILYEFPIAAVEFYMPKWVEMLPADHELKAELVNHITEMMPAYTVVRDVLEKPIGWESEVVRKCRLDKISLADGTVTVSFDIDKNCYYTMLSGMIGEPVEDEYQLVEKMKTLSAMKQEYQKVLQAMESVRAKGYGVVTPQREEIRLEKPELTRHGNKYGVRIRALSPSIHMIRANIQTEIAPIVGTKEQAEDLIAYVDRAQGQDGIWDTNIFGKTVEQLVSDGITSKIMGIGDESQQKLQDSMQKIVNDSSGGMVCIII